jgi:allantoate deiminase
MNLCDLLGDISEDNDRLTRRFATPAMKRAYSWVQLWMESIGMTVRVDAAGNLIGRYAATNPDAPALLLGSHLDTVRNAGRYDGPLGVLCALACVQDLANRGRRLPFAIEVIAFADEEGVRYHTAYLGSAALVGAFQHAWLERTDDQGVSMATALQGFGGDPAQLAAAQRQPSDFIGYCEVHIEQGPVLEAENLPVGVVTAIAAQQRVSIVWVGEAGHAGTVPMHLRYDALAGAAAFVLAAEAVGRATPGLVVTVGQLTVQPGASNVIPGTVTLSLDVRHQENAHVHSACRALYEQAIQIASDRQLSMEWRTVQHNNAVQCSPALQQVLAHAIEQCGLPSYHLPSGAGHDSVMLSRITDCAMLFVRCQRGISHHPAEAVAVADVAVALRVLQIFVDTLAERHTAFSR